MSLPLIVILSFLALMSTSVLTSQMLSVLTMERYAAVRVADQAETTAQVSLVSGIGAHVAQNVRLNADPGATIENVSSTWAEPLTVAGTKYLVNYSGSVSSGGTRSSTTGIGQATNDNAQNVQDAPFVKEERFSASVRVQVVDATQKLIVATRTRFITFRVMRAAPYVMIDGARELGAIRGRAAQATGQATAALGDAGGPGDSGGVSGAATAPDGNAPTAYQDTTIKAHSGCANVNSNDGLPWGTGVNQNAVSMQCTYGQNVSRQGPVDSLNGKHWTTPNTNGTQWSW